MSETGVVFGRFQMVHLGYMEYILSAKRKCDRMIIGIANCDSNHLLYNRYQNGCLREKMNPFSYYERMEMIQAGLDDFNVSRMDYNIVPFPLEDPVALAAYIPMDAVIYMFVFDEWGREKRSALEKYGYKVEVIRFGRPSDKRNTSPTVLKYMGLGGNWERMAPKGVCRYIREHGLDKRVEALWNQPFSDDESTSSSQVKYSADYERERSMRSESGFTEREPSIDELARRYDQEVWEQQRGKIPRTELDIM